MKVLVVEDDAMIRQRVSSALESAGHEVLQAGALGEARALLAEQGPAFVVLDRNLPDGEGLDLLHELRSSGNEIPVLLLTALAETEDKVGGLDAGADDYLTKPFEAEELLARIRSIARRIEYKDTVQVGDLEVDIAARRAIHAGTDLSLTSREFALLATFARHAGKALTRDDLLEKAWGIREDPHTNVVDVYVRHLRSKLGTGWIETIRGVGYRMPESGPDNEGD